jgi:hypothetical protein
LVGLAPNHPHDHSGVLNRLLLWFFGAKTALMLSMILMRLFVVQNCPHYQRLSAFFVTGIKKPDNYRAQLFAKWK